MRRPPSDGSRSGRVEESNRVVGDPYSYRRSDAWPGPKASEKRENITLKRLAPNATRTAASLVRSAARASSRFATFAHATGSTKIAATIMAVKIVLMRPWLWESTKVSNWIPRPSFVSGCSPLHMSVQSKTPRPRGHRALSRRIPRKKVTDSAVTFLSVLGGRIRSHEL